MKRKSNELNVIVQTKLHEKKNNQAEKKRRLARERERTRDREQTMRKEIEWMCV